MTGLRPLTEADLPQCYDFVTKYLARFAIAPALSFGEFRHHFATREKLLATYIVEVRINTLVTCSFTYIKTGSGDKTNLGSVLVLLHSQASIIAPSLQDHQLGLHSVLYCPEDTCYRSVRVVIDHR